jgi:hypothetical protein
MKHVFGLRRGDSSLILRGTNGRAIRQHIVGAGAHHNHMLKNRNHDGGALNLNSIMHTMQSAPRAISNVVKKGTGATARTYIPLKFRL